MSRQPLITLLRLYKKFLSPVLGNRCRFHPSCSDYTREAIELYGAARGTLFGLKRILRCNPFFEGGVDPVPGTEANYPKLLDSEPANEEDTDQERNCR